jgi:very-short-patch-repair endonuclease
MTIFIVKIRKMKKISTEEFIKKARKVHGDKYDYSKVKYVNNYTKVCIICPIHGEFLQNPNSHLQGFGCKKCGNINTKEKQILGKEKFLKKAKEVHGDKYDYSKVEYVNNETKVCIICPIHGKFLQSPASHVNRKSGCPFCAAEQNINESNLYYELIHGKVGEIVRQKKFKWLKYKNPMSLDFYIPSKSVAIEYQGDQHFRSVQWYGGEKGFKEQLDRDLNKIKLCEEHGIKLFHFTYNDDIKWNEYEIYTDIKKLLVSINERKDK